MNINQKVIDHFREQAARSLVRRVTIGLGYTAVEIENSRGTLGMGLSYTWLPGKTGCHVIKEYTNFEGRPASLLVEKWTSGNTIERTIALACVNALNYHRAAALPEESGDTVIYEVLGVGPGSKVAMVGYFKPLIPPMKKRGAEVEIIDIHHQVGDEVRFTDRLENWADTFIITATAFLNNSIEGLLSRIPEGGRAVVLGPSTPMVPEIFEGYPITMLAGTVPLDFEAVERSVRHGTGTPVIQKYGKKVSIRLYPPATG